MHLKDAQLYTPHLPLLFSFQPVINFAPADRTVDESSGHVVISIVASQSFPAETTISVQTEDVTAGQCSMLQHDI